MNTGWNDLQKLPAGTVSSLLIDADSLSVMRHKLGWDMDLQKLAEWVREHYNVPRIVYFATVGREQTEGDRRQQKWLSYRGFELVLREETKHGSHGGRERAQTRIPVEIAMEAASSPATCDHVILLTRNLDLATVGVALKRSHRWLTVLCDEDCPADLRCSATQFVAMNELRSRLERPPAPRQTETV